SHPEIAGRPAQRGTAAQRRWPAPRKSRPQHGRPGRRGPARPHRQGARGHLIRIRPFRRRQVFALAGVETSAPRGKIDSMFTGLVQALGIVLVAADTPAGKRLTVSLAELADAPIQPGDSVCVSGVCLTAVKTCNGNLHFDVITETLQRSTLGSKK